jgi:hypothetical protein
MKLFPQKNELIVHNNKIHLVNIPQNVGLTENYSHHSLSPFQAGRQAEPTKQNKTKQS